jgi:hypothetical protein
VVRNAETSTVLEIELINIILKMDNMLDEMSERLIYAEAQRTHPKDIIVGDNVVRFIGKQEDKGEPRW